MKVIRDSIRSFISDIISKKFVVFLIACLFLMHKHITPDMWLYVALAYMSANFMERLADVFRRP